MSTANKVPRTHKRWFRGISAGNIDHLRGSLKLFDSFKVRPLVGKVFDFVDANEAFRTHEKQNFVGKVMIKGE
ncbi:hypothetical protein BKA62DRAFT_702588 [Auriculariales sp. MPI-PUGE-AT-0066]|nr:hypothetical protein BKA62DRAFT_702588 [Auriculariales sp. MPI-PUGE-AT-0066]